MPGVKIVTGCILSGDVGKIDHHTHWHDGFSGPSAGAGAGSIGSRALGPSNCSASRSSWRLNRLHVLFHILGHPCFATAFTFVSGDHASSESHAKPPSEKYCKTSQFAAYVGPRQAKTFQFEAAQQEEEGGAGGQQDGAAAAADTLGFEGAESLSFEGAEREE